MVRPSLATRRGRGMRASARRLLSVNRVGARHRAARRSDRGYVFDGIRQILFGARERLDMNETIVAQPGLGSARGGHVRPAVFPRHPIPSAASRENDRSRSRSKPWSPEPRTVLEGWRSSWLRRATHSVRQCMWLRCSCRSASDCDLFRCASRLLPPSRRNILIDVRRSRQTAAYIAVSARGGVSNVRPFQTGGHAGALAGALLPRNVPTLRTLPGVRSRSARATAHVAGRKVPETD
jgi:hypothetical protein